MDGNRSHCQTVFSLCLEDITLLFAGIFYLAKPVLSERILHLLQEIKVSPQGLYLWNMVGVQDFSTVTVPIVFLYWQPHGSMHCPATAGDCVQKYGHFLHSTGLRSQSRNVRLHCVFTIWYCGTAWHSLKP
jgi:hypothetical protein